jgi:hypothetical protein
METAIMSEKKGDFGYRVETKASVEQVAHREVLYELFRNHPMPVDQLMIVLGLYLRSSALAKILFLHEMYHMILDLPGVIMEFGSWWGQNLILFENLRAIFEPFNQSRRIIGFDTYKGYISRTDRDGSSDIIEPGAYSVGEEYREYLEQLIDYHEKNNILGTVKKHSLVAGDVAETVPAFFKENPETVVALAYFDMALYEPTKVALETIRPHLVPGSVLMLDEYNNKDYPGETVAFKEVFGTEGYTVRRSNLLADRAYIILK